jgi:cell division septation protein DedD
MAAPAPAASKPVVAAATKPGKGGKAYVVIGSYKVEDNAKRVMREHQALKPTMKTVTVRGERYIRVIAGPFSATDAASIKQRLKSKDGIDAFTAGVCSGKSGGRCIDPNEG